jgi:hypothetical protein
VLGQGFLDRTSALAYFVHIINPEDDSALDKKIRSSKIEGWSRKVIDHENY